MIFLRLFAILLCLVLSTHAADFYATPSGAGNQNGSDWENAIADAQITSFINQSMQAGDRLFVGSGTFFSKIDVNKSGEFGLPLIVEGVDTGDGLPEFVGTWSETDPGSSNGSHSAVSLDGVSDVSVKNLRIRHWMYGVHTGSGENVGITLENLFMREIREGIYLKNFHESKIINCEFIKYTKRGIRFDGDVNFVEVTGVFADHNDGDAVWPQEWPFGFMIEEKEENHDITFRNCVSQNNIQARDSGDYWNGDGFVAEKTAYHIRYINCQAYDNADGGWDDKSRAPVLENCIAFRNKRNFRFWNINGSDDEPARMINCIGGYAVSPGGSGSQAGVWTSGDVSIEHCTFHNNKSHALALETGNDDYTVSVNNSILSADPDYLPNYRSSRLVSKESGVTLDMQNTESIVMDENAMDPQYNQDDANWNGEPPNAFNSQTFGPAIGYFYDVSRVGRRTKAPQQVGLAQNYPNPFNPRTRIEYAVPARNYVNVSVFDLRGRLVRTLVGEVKSAGQYTVDVSGIDLASGVYLYALSIGEYYEVRKMTRLK